MPPRKREIRKHTLCPRWIPPHFITGLGRNWNRGTRYHRVFVKIYSSRNGDLLASFHGEFKSNTVEYEHYGRYLYVGPLPIQKRNIPNINNWRCKHANGYVPQDPLGNNSPRRPENNGGHPMLTPIHSDEDDLGQYSEVDDPPPVKMEAAQPSDVDRAVKSEPASSSSSRVKQENSTTTAAIKAEP